MILPLRQLVLPAAAIASGAAGEHLHLGQKIALFFQQSGLPDWAVLALISATPAIELRGGSSGASSMRVESCAVLFRSLRSKRSALDNRKQF